MTSRRRTPQQSSLELFLDTICNTFGGIVFLSILLSVIVQQRSKQATTRETNDGVKVSVSEAKQIEHRAAQLKAKIEQLPLLISDLQALQPGSDDHELASKAEEVRRVNEELQSLTKQQAEESQRLSEQLRKNTELAESQAAAAGKADQAEAELSDEKVKLEELIDERLEVLKLPKVESISKRSVVMLMRFGRIYPLLNRADEPDSDHLRVFDGNPLHMVVEPLKDRGWDPSTGNGAQSLLRYLNNYPSTRFIAHIFVWPDSFAEFGEVKAALIRADYQYELEPYGDDDSITLTRSPRTPSVQ